MADLIALAMSIYPSAYLENDSLDRQFISIFALKLMDNNNLAQLVYNNRSPATAIGSSLDGIVKINGLSRKTASYSTCEVQLTGTNGTIITGGIVSDVAGYAWDLPTPITIPSGGLLTVTATCETIGSITA
ncbi:MAG: baseplate J/gp47 family protein, partial [Parabacteroides sp.]